MSPEKYFLESVETNLRKEIHQFEFSSLKSKRKILDFQKNNVIPKINLLKEYENKTKGFNIQAFLISSILVHIGIIYKNKILLNEMHHKAIRHILILITFGTINGFIFGYNYSKSFTLYRIYKNTLNNVNKLNQDFEYFYVNKNEEEFEE